jgi:hypothetical protein
VWATEEAKFRAYAEHGFVPEKPPHTIRALRERVSRLDPELVMRQVQRAGFPRPDDAHERESDELWSNAEWIQNATPSLPRLPAKPVRGDDRLAALREWCDRCDVAEAYAAASAFVHHAGTLAFQARAHRSRDIPESVWKKLGSTYAMAFIAWVDLSSLLTQAVRDVARSTRGLDAPVVRIGKSRACESVLAAVADELGTAFRNALYSGRRHPLEPDVGKIVAVAKAEKPFGYGDLFQSLLKKETNAVIRARLGIQTWEDALLLMVAEWEKQNPDSVWAVFTMLRFGEVDFDELEIRLAQEARVATAEPPRAARSAQSGSRGSQGRSIDQQIDEVHDLHESWYSAAWYHAATKWYGGKGTVPLKPGELSRAKSTLVSRPRATNRRQLEYTVSSVCGHSVFKQYTKMIHAAIADGMTEPKRGQRSE